MQASRTKGLSTLKEWRALAPSTITSQLWNWRTGIECVVHGMARETVSISIRTSVNAQRIWYDGLAAFLGAPPRGISIPTCAKGFSGVAVVSGDVLLRWEKSNANGRSHEFMNENEKWNNDSSVDGLWERKHFLPGCFRLLW